MERIHRIVVGIDFSPEAELALRHALALARRVGARVALVHVGTVPDRADLEAMPNEVARQFHQALQDELAAARRGLEDLRVRYLGQGVELSHDVVNGWPEGGLLQAATELDADLIVVGSHGRTGLRRLVLGSFAERTVRHADRSVLVARGELPARGYQRILVGHDFSPASDRGIDLALAVAGADAGIDVHVVHAWRLLMPSQGYEIAALSDVTARLRGDLAAAAADRGRALIAARADARVRFDPVEREAATGLAAIASDEHSDLVVVGAHGRRGLRRWIMGSTAEATVRHAPCSVLVAR